MTEAEWLVCDNSWPMLTLLGEKVSERRAYLIAAAFLRRFWHLIPDQRSRAAVAAMERYADGLASREERRAAHGPARVVGAELMREERAKGILINSPRWLGRLALTQFAAGPGEGGQVTTGWLREFAFGAVPAHYASEQFDYSGDPLAAQIPGQLPRSVREADGAAVGREREAQAVLLRDVIGNPFRRAADWPWLTPTIASLARAAYDERALPAGTLDPARLAVLADAIEEAGCSDVEVVSHLRGPGPHVRGCWVVDQLLGCPPQRREGVVSEEEWLTCPDPPPLLEFVWGKASARKLRLFAAACCRRVWGLLRDDGYRDLVALAERCADEGSGGDEVRRLAERMYDHPHSWLHTRPGGIDGSDAEHAALFLAGAPPGAIRGGDEHGRIIFANATEEVLSPTYQARYAAEFVARALTRQGDPAAGATAHAALRDTSVSLAARAAAEGEHADLFREISGNPFRPPALDPAWRTPAVVSLAQAAYDDRLMPSGELKEARLAVLADALDEAGCTDADILSHLRSAGPHVRGCWVLDLILGKE
jgi:hypothetical protein